MNLHKIYGIGLGVVMSIGVQTAWADKADDTLRIAWGNTDVMQVADNYYGNTRAGIWFTKSVWDELIERDPATGEYSGNLASGWTWIDDTTLELSLRKGVKFHNGEAFDADDVVYTFDKVKSDDAAKRKKLLKWIARVEKVDQFTVRIHTNDSFPQAIEYLTILPVYPNEYYAKVGTEGMSKMPIGTGPYKVVEMKPGEQYTLVRNEDYDWGSPKSKAKIKHVVIREIPDLQTQVAELLAGGIDMTPDLTTDLVENLQSMAGVDAQQSETLRIFYMRFDAAGRTGVEALKDVRVRRAISHAVNRQSIVDNLMGGAASVIDTPCHPKQFGCIAAAAVSYEYDAGKARMLLADAGYSDGLELELYACCPAHEAEAVIGDLAKVGITAKLNRLPWEAYAAALAKGKTPLFLTNWGSNSLADASAIISYFFTLGPDDYARDPQVTEWLKVADTSTDPEKRKAFYAKAIERITDQAYLLSLYTGVRGYGYDSILNFIPYVDEVLRFHEYSWK